VSVPLPEEQEDSVSVPLPEEREDSVSVPLPEERDESNTNVSAMCRLSGDIFMMLIVCPLVAERADPFDVVAGVVLLRIDRKAGLCCGLNQVTLINQGIGTRDFDIMPVHAGILKKKAAHCGSVACRNSI
jgi:hypothetical protein